MFEKVGSYNVIGEGCEFGVNIKLGNFNEIGSNCKIGNNVIIQGRVRIGNNCIIEDNVVLKIGCILTASVLMQEGSFLGPNSVLYGSDYSREEEHGTIIGKNVWIGGNSGVAASVHICDNTVIGALSFVRESIYQAGVYAGSPIKLIRLFSPFTGTVNNEQT